MKLLLRYARSYLLWFIALVLLIVVQGCAQLFGLTREMKNIVDQGIQTGDMNYIMHSGLRMLVFTALVAVCGALIAWIGGRISCGMRKDMIEDSARMTKYRPPASRCQGNASKSSSYPASRRTRRIVWAVWKADGQF